MRNSFTQYFVTMARRANREGVKLSRSGQPGAAFAKFVERDLLMERARG